MKMPQKLLILLVLMGLQLLWNLYELATIEKGQGMQVVVVVIQGLLILGIFKGSDSVRKILYFFAFLGLGFAGLALIGGLGLGNVAAIIAGALGIGINGYFIWCLSDDEVKQWMLRKSLNMDELEASDAN